MEPTALVHEAYLRVARLDRLVWQGKTHFFAVAAVQMRRILVEHARQASALKRCGDLEPFTVATVSGTLDVLCLDGALDRLARRSDRQSKVAEMRLFAGMQYTEIAEVLGVSERTVRNDWRFSRTWLARELRGTDGGHPRAS